MANIDIVESINQGRKRNRVVWRELIIVNAVTRRAVIDIDPLNVPTPGTGWVRSDADGLAAFVDAAHTFTAESGAGVDIIGGGNVTRSFESACNHHVFGRLVDMVPVDGTLTNPARCADCAR